MTSEEMETQAIAKVKAANPDSKNWKIEGVFENVMDGTFITVRCQKNSGTEFFNYVYFARNEIRLYKYLYEAMGAISNYKERVWFFRFLEFAGMGGLIAITLIFIFSVLLFALAFSANANASVVEVVKYSFSIILGYFFGSQVAGRTNRSERI